MSSNDYQLQVSVRTPAGTLINLPADSHEDAVVMLGVIRSLATDIVATEQGLAAAHNAAPLVVPAPAAPTPPTQAAPVAPPPPPILPPSPPAAAPGSPQCPHGARVWKTGVSKAGKPWGAWMCANSNAPDKCDPDWDRNYGK